MKSENTDKNMCHNLNIFCLLCTVVLSTTFYC